MAGSVRSKFSTHHIGQPETDALRNLPNINLKLVKKLKDQDLSLVRLGLSLCSTENKVYILTNDQDLLDFISWARTQNSLKSATTTPKLLEGISGITFMDLVHRGCHISSEQMMKMLRFVIEDTMERMDETGAMVLSRDKGNKIISDVTQKMSEAFVKSMEIKVREKELRDDRQ